MLMRICAAAALGCLALAVSGCGDRAAPAKGKPADKQQPPAAGASELTIYIEGMVERQNITWHTWRNKVQEALSGLPGVEEVTADLKKDLLHIRYDPASVTHEQVLQAIEKQGFTGKIQPGGGWWRRLSWFHFYESFSVAPRHNHRQK